MAVDPRKHYQRGMYITGSAYPAMCKGLPTPQKRRTTPTDNLKEIAARLEAARLRLAEIAMMVRRK